MNTLILHNKEYMKTFILDKNYKIECYFLDATSGFIHEAELYYKENLVKNCKITYDNRTWEAFEFQAICHKVIKEYFTFERIEKYLKLLG
jgi:hypothetical protein